MKSTILEGDPVLLREGLLPLLTVGVSETINIEQYCHTYEVYHTGGGSPSSMSRFHILTVLFYIYRGI